MLRKILLLLFPILGGGSVLAQSDTLLMRVGHLPVSRAEYQYAYSKYPCNKDNFFTHYVELKEKVCQAQAEGLDTTSAFRRKFEACKQVLKAQTALPLRPADRGGSEEKGEWVAHVCIRVPQSVSHSGMERLRSGLDSVARVARQGGGLACWAREHGDCLPDGWQAEVIPVVSGRLPNELLACIARLHPGEMSRPFSSAVGLHLIQRLDSVPEPPSSPVPAMNAAEQAFLLREYRDGLLAGMLDEKLLHVDERALEKYYKKHKKHYRWKLPHFKGMVLQADDEEKLERLQKYLKAFPQEQWDEAVSRFDSIGNVQGVKAEYGLWQIGRNACVDKLFFGQGEFVPSADYPHVRVMGKVLKRKPESYRDVRARVERDYRADICRREREKRAKMFKVEINEEVLKTVKD